MHTGNLETIQTVIGHYGTITLAPGNTNLDPRLRPNGSGPKLHLTATDVNSVIAFLKTLTELPSILILNGLRLSIKKKDPKSTNRFGVFLIY